MALDSPKPPAAVTASLTAGLRRLPARNRNSYATEMGGGSPPAVSTPYQVFTLSPEDLTGGSSLEDAKPTAWRYLLSQGSQGLAGGSALEEFKEAPEVATAEVLIKDPAPQFSQLQFGWISNATQRAIAVAQALPEMSSGKYELRMFRLPAVYVDAIWLKNKEVGSDLYIPILGVHKALTPFRAYRSDEFLSTVRDLVAKKARFDNSPEEPAAAG
jgi:hypothetical protein